MIFFFLFSHLSFKFGIKLQDNTCESLGRPRKMLALHCCCGFLSTKCVFSA